jgi:two-component system nitrogen regulation sensor histidine kinase NtrY
VRHLARWWAPLVLLACAAAAEWLRQPSPLWVLGAVLAGIGAAAALRPWSSWRRRSLVAALVGLGFGLGAAHWQLRTVETAWEAKRSATVESASRELRRSLRRAYRAVRGLAAAAAEPVDTNRETGFRQLAQAVPIWGPEMGIALLDSATDAPWAWAGHHRLPPTADGDSIGVRTTGYYVVLEARRHSRAGRVAVASVLLWAHASVPERDRSLAEMLRRKTDVSLVFYPPGAAPNQPDIFDYEEPTTRGSRLLFSVLPVPPEQGVARELVFERGSRVVVWLVLLTLTLAFSLAPRPLERYLILAFGVWLSARAPIGAALGARALFSPATFFRPLLGPLSSSAGVLALTGFLFTLAGVWLWRRRGERRWYGVAMAAALLVASPSLVIALARGITPPARGAPPGLWLSWEVTLLFAASAPIVLATALFRGTAPTAERWRVRAGVAIALAVSIVGVFGWSPDGWPDWYPFLWVPALLLVALPAPRSATILGIGLVAGSSAALATWGAELAGRMQVAQRDVARLGEEPDPLAVPLLEGFGEAIRRGAPPGTPSQMYALWGESQLGDQSYPAHLALWSREGTLKEELPLDSLDIPLPLLSSMVRSLPAGQHQRVTPLRRVPGVHYVLLVRTGSASVMTVAVGPRSRLVPPGRLGRLLDPERREATPYRLALSPPGPVAADDDSLRWRREGWALRAERRLTLPAGPREIRAEIDLRGPLPVFVRGVLVVLFDAGVLALAWLLAEYVAGVPPPPPRWRSLAQSFRFRLAVTLAAFFILPAVGFSIWGFVRLAAEAERSRDLLITQTLRDAQLGAPGLERARGAQVEDQLRDLSRRIDADLALYRGGVLVATSAPVLQDLGVVGELMDPVAFRSFALRGQLELTREGPMPELRERIGFRVVQPGTPTSLGVLATPQVADDSSLGARQLDLGLVLLLATIIGVVAALAGARRAALALSRPVSELRRSAIALGKGQPMPAHSANPPLEFEPVFGAFERMAADIRSSQNALEEARRRTATVLATVATGVVGLDQDGRVIIANRQAVDLLGVPLAEGDLLLEYLGAEWGTLVEAVRRFLAAPVGAADAGAELTVGGRRLTLQLASLGPDLRGAVLALNDVTDLSRAERVLAWGEMARQVAHEIKNPLTPLRLGIQHLRRVWQDGREDFGGALEETAARILAEIDRLDTIARAFSRFAAPALAQDPVEPVDLAAIAGEVVHLYQLAGEGAVATVRLEVAGAAWGQSRRDELKEVLVNLLENARNAGARTITVEVSAGCVEVRDDGSGIPPNLLPRIFEPRFSTTTSGSGLGLAIVRRLVESWGGVVEVDSVVGRGTTAAVRFATTGVPAPAAEQD